MDNDSWYTTKEVVTQEASTGHRKVTALVTYKNGNETGREIIAQTIVTEAKPKIIERGTQAPPTYIKPFRRPLQLRIWKTLGQNAQRCRLGMLCGNRSKGILRRHRCQCWLVQRLRLLLTIRHPDGKQTRYAHLSKNPCFVRKIRQAGRQDRSQRQYGKKYRTAYPF